MLPGGSRQLTSTLRHDGGPGKQHLRPSPPGQHQRIVMRHSHPPEPAPPDPAPTAGTRSLGRGPPSPPDPGGQWAPLPGELAGTPGSKSGANTATEPAAQAPYPGIDAQAQSGSINETAVAATARASSA